MYHNNLILILPTPSAQKSNIFPYTYSSTQLRQLKTKVSHKKRLQILQSGSISCIRKIKIKKKTIKTTE